jgi:hypothetical protein
MGTGIWKVMRHGGRKTDHWRQVFAGDESAARVAFSKEDSRLIQGSITLLDPDGKTIAHRWARKYRSP